MTVKIEVADKWFITFINNLKQKDNILELYEEYKTTTPMKKKKTDKDPNAPKKPMNGFMFYCNEVRTAKKSKGEKITVKEIGEAWKKLSVSSKTKYVNMASHDKQRYESEMEEYGPVVKQTKDKVPKRKKSGWDMFCKENRANYEGNTRDVTKQMGEEWSALSGEDKATYIQMADEYNEEHPVEKKSKKTASSSNESDSKKSKKSSESDTVEKVKKTSKESTKKGSKIPAPEVEEEVEEAEEEVLEDVEEDVEKEIEELIQDSTCSWEKCTRVCADKSKYCKIHTALNAAKKKTK